MPTTASLLASISSDRLDPAGLSLHFSGILSSNAEPALISRRKIRIFAGRFSISVARQVFHQLFRSTSFFGDSLARQPNLWPGIQVSAGTIDLLMRNKCPFMH